jgi:hypothetical protein
VEYVSGIFGATETLSFVANNIFVTSELESVIEFSLTIDGKNFAGVDIIEWDRNLLMLSMRAYLYEKSNG